MTMDWVETPVSGAGVRLAAYEGPDRGPPVLFVHGYPQTHAMWDAVASRLSDRFRCLAYDVRGAGRSDPGRRTADYALRMLRTDLAAVVDRLSPDVPVHLVGHDWGSIQAWDALVREEHAADPSERVRFASFTSISGPCLHHVAEARRTAWRSGRSGRRALAGQLRHSSYVVWFQLPLVPERVLARVADRRQRAASGRPGVRQSATLPDDAVNGLGLYRANIFHREPLDGPPSTSQPVHLVVLTEDRYVGPVLVDHVDRYAADLTRTEIAAGHWAPQTHPEAVAAAIRRFVADRSGS